MDGAGRPISLEVLAGTPLQGSLVTANQAYYGKDNRLLVSIHEWYDDGALTNAHLRAFDYDGMQRLVGIREATGDADDLADWGTWLAPDGPRPSGIAALQNITLDRQSASAGLGGEGTDYQRNALGTLTSETDDARSPLWTASLYPNGPGIASVSFDTSAYPAAGENAALKWDDRGRLVYDGARTFTWSADDRLRSASVYRPHVDTEPVVAQSEGLLYDPLGCGGITAASCSLLVGVGS